MRDKRKVIKDLESIIKSEGVENPREVLWDPYFLMEIYTFYSNNKKLEDAISYYFGEESDVIIKRISKYYEELKNRRVSRRELVKTSRDIEEETLQSIASIIASHSIYGIEASDTLESDSPQTNPNDRKKNIFEEYLMLNLVFTADHIYRELHSKEFAEHSLESSFDEVNFLGGGIEAATFKVVDSQIKRPRALKVILREENKEGQILGELEEITVKEKEVPPNIVRVHSSMDVYWQGSKKRALLLEYVEGRTLDDFLCEGELSGDDNRDGIFRKRRSMARNIIISLVNAVQWLYNHNIYHNDIHPRNIIISNDGSIKIIDFGFASKGKPNTRGNKRYGPDLLAIASIYYRLITGKRFFLESGVETLKKGSIAHKDSIADNRSRYLSGDRKIEELVNSQISELPSTSRRLLRLLIDKRIDYETKMKNLGVKFKKRKKWSLKKQLAALTMIVATTAIIQNIKNPSDNIAKENTQPIIIEAPASVSRRPTPRVSTAKELRKYNMIIEAEESYENREYSKALTIVRKAEEINASIRDDYRINLIRGRDMLRRGNILKAQKLFYEALEDCNDPVGKMRIYRNLAEIQIQHRQYDQALLWYNKAVEATPDNYEVYIVRAELKNEMGIPSDDDLMRAKDLVLKEKPRDANTLIEKINSLTLQHRHSPPK